MDSKPLRIMFSAGEASGDQHAAKVIRQLHQNGNFECFGMGGVQCQAAGMKLLTSLVDHAFMGVGDIFRHYSKLKHALQTMEAALREQRPDLLVTVDFSGFNMKLASKAHKLGIKVLIYIAPQIWAWRPRRIKTIATIADRVALTLPFEKDLYDCHQVTADYVGHPLVETMTDIPPLPDRDIAKDHYKILLLPGSRLSEIKQLMPILRETMEHLTQRSPKNISFYLLLAQSIEASQLLDYLTAASCNYTLIDGKELSDREKYQHFVDADVAISASGTAVLQLALCQTPTVVIYKLSRFNWILLRRLIKLQFISLPNILSKRRIIPELIQDDATAQRISDEVIDLLCNDTRRKAMRTDLAEVQNLLGSEHASQNVARIISEMCR